MSDKISVYTPYTPDYIMKCKAFWYANGRLREDTKLMKLLEDQKLVDEYGRTPSLGQIKKWRKEFMWDAWADELDAQANSLMEKDLISQKAEMVRKHAELGFQLQELGLGYLKAEGFDSSSSAVQAIIRGAQLERESRGISELLLKLSKMSTNELMEEVNSMLQRLAINKAIDAEEIPPKENDTESTA